MPYLHIFLVLFFLLQALESGASNDPLVRRNFEAVRTGSDITVDGILNEDAWQTSNQASGFFQYAPRPGDPASERTVVHLLYDDVAIYVGAYLYDSEPQKILKEFTERDRQGNFDWFGLWFDTYKDGQNAFTFMVSAAGTQTDIRITATEEDRNWDAVWESEVKIMDDGWVVEMKIPFSMLRFSGERDQEWRVNFGRSIRKNGEEVYWNPVRPDIQGLILQSGIMSGIEEIRPSVRLMLTPYLISYLNESHHRAEGIRPDISGNVNGGMDLKYGISKAFTLDAILVPDFGQVQLDDQVLNLSPFEIRFNENRQFFTEGVELFNKSGLFYSRRIGGNPFYAGRAFSSLQPGETLISNPTSSRLINASKITGRTAGGTGIGFFNALEGETYAVIREEDGGERSVLVGPRTNYNLLVVDQNLPNAGSVTLTNTNVMREGGAYDANVTGLNYQLRNRQQRYSLSGGFFYNRKSGRQVNEDGYSYRISAGKISGAFTGSMNYSVESLDYDINDLGFLRIANRRNISINAAYNWFKPFGAFQSASIKLFSFYLHLHEPNVYSEQYNKIDVSFLLKSQASFGFNTSFEILKSHDYYEPRTRDFSLFFLEPRNLNLGVWANSDARQPFRYGGSFNYRRYFSPGRHRFTSRGFMTWQTNNHFTASWDLQHYAGLGDVGFATNYGDDVILGVRDQHTVENSLTIKYAFNERLSSNLRIRHYWTKVDYERFGALRKNGLFKKSDYEAFDENGNSLHDFTVDFFTTDLRIIWRYAPGSDLSFVWKQSINQLEQRALGTYFSNLSQLASFAQSNSFSIRVNYFLDYASIRRSLADRS